MSDLWSQAIGKLNPDESAAKAPEPPPRRRTPATAPFSDEPSGFDQTMEIARQRAEAEMIARTAQIKADAVDEFVRVNSQRPMQSRTNRVVIGMLVATGLRAIVDTGAASTVFADPAVAQAATSLIGGGLELAMVGLGALAIKFRNAATKFIN